MISRSLRFEVLRRDGFACTYCGRKPPDVELHIDHVVPSSLGGQDTPDNLRAACADCNAGKGSTPPAADLVANVRADAERWATAIKQASEEATAQLQDADLTWFTDEWNEWLDYYKRPLPLPANWPDSIRRWQELGLSQTAIQDMIRVAMSRNQVPAAQVFTYFAGCCWRQVTALQERAAQIIDSET